MYFKCIGAIQNIRKNKKGEQKQWQGVRRENKEGQAGKEGRNRNQVIQKVRQRVKDRYSS